MTLRDLYEAFNSDLVATGRFSTVARARLWREPPPEGETIGALIGWGTTTETTVGDAGEAEQFKRTVRFQIASDAGDVDLELSDLMEVLRRTLRSDNDGCYHGWPISLTWGDPIWDLPAPGSRIGLIAADLVFDHTINYTR